MIKDESDMSGYSVELIDSMDSIDFEIVPNFGIIQSISFIKLKDQSSIRKIQKKRSLQFKVCFYLENLNSNLSFQTLCL